MAGRPDADLLFAMALFDCDLKRDSLRFVEFANGYRKLRSCSGQMQGSTFQTMTPDVRVRMCACVRVCVFACVRMCIILLCFMSTV